MDRMKIVFNDVPLFLAKKIKELVVRNNFNCKIEWYVENGDTRTLANLQVLQSKLNHPRQ